MFSKKKSGFSFGKISLPTSSGTSQAPAVADQTPGPTNDAEEGGFGSFGKTGQSLKPDQVTNDEERDNAQEAEIAKVMGFSGFGKSAKSFDVEALVQEAKKLAASNMSKPEAKDVVTPEAGGIYH
jgi:hypothetical protein